MKIIRLLAVLLVFCLSITVAYNAGDQMRTYKEGRVFLSLLANDIIDIKPENKDGFFLAYYWGIESSNPIIVAIVNLKGEKLKDDALDRMVENYTVRYSKLGKQPPWKNTEELRLFLEKHNRRVKIN